MRRSPEVLHTVEGLREAVAAGHVEEVLLALPDLNGRLVGTRLDASYFCDHVVAHGFGACTYLLTTDVEMQVAGRSGELDPQGTGFGDLLLVPDLATARPLPWDPGTVLVTADALHADRTPVTASPRQALKTQVQALAGLGVEAFAGAELEFRVFAESYESAALAGWRGLTPATRGNVDYALVGMERMDVLTRRLRRDMVAAGLQMESARGECAPGQYEIVFRYARALETADATAFYKTGAKQVAAAEGMSLTFMPRYDAGEGSSCHLHVSLRGLDGSAVLAGGGVAGRPDLAGTSPLLRRMLAGQLACLRELTLLFAPTVNAYKRLRPGAFAPTTVAWGRDNRLAAVRLVGSGESLRLEHRVPGGDADPYLALAGVLLAARHGIEHGLEAPPAVVGAPGTDVARLPASLPEAADLLSGSEVARKGLGDDLVDALVSAAHAEWDSYCAAVSEWERSRGFQHR